MENAEECNKQGTLECGICMCYKNYFGHNCECDRPVTNVPCQKNSETTVVCSGRGLCICGKCECDKGINAGEVCIIINLIYPKVGNNKFMMITNNFMVQHSQCMIC